MKGSAPGTRVPVSGLPRLSRQDSSLVQYRKPPWGLSRPRLLSLSPTWICQGLTLLNILMMVFFDGLSLVSQRNIWTW